MQMQQCDGSRLLVGTRQSQGSGVVTNVVSDEGGNEVVGVVVTRLHPDVDTAGPASFGGRRGEGLRFKLVFQETIGSSLKQKINK